MSSRWVGGCCLTVATHLQGPHSAAAPGNLQVCSLLLILPARLLGPSTTCAAALCACHCHCQGKVECVQDDAAALRPTLFVGVPRVWERVREGVAKRLATRTPIARYVCALSHTQDLSPAREQL